MKAYMMKETYGPLIINDADNSASFLIYWTRECEYVETLSWRDIPLGNEITISIDESNFTDYLEEYFVPAFDPTYIFNQHHFIRHAPIAEANFN